MANESNTNPTTPPGRHHKKLPQTTDVVLATCSVLALVLSVGAIIQVRHQETLVADQLTVSHVESLNYFATACVDSPSVLPKELKDHLCAARQLTMQIAATNVLRATIGESHTRLNPVALKHIKDALDVQLLAELDEASLAAKKNDASLCTKDTWYGVVLWNTLAAHYLLDKPRVDDKGAPLSLEEAWKLEERNEQLAHENPLKDPTKEIFRTEQFLRVSKAIDSVKSMCSPAS